MSAPQIWQICSPGVPEGRGSFASDVCDSSCAAPPYPCPPAPDGPLPPLLLFLAALWSPQNQTAWRRVPEAAAPGWRAVGLSVTCCDAVTCINPT